jgi:putative ABC transport system permease protein
MEYQELIEESRSTLFLNKVRTGLAMLGVIIGIGSVIALVSLGQASQKSVSDQIKSLGANLLTVMPGSFRSEGVRSAQGGVTTLTYDDAKAILSSQSVTTVKKVASEYSRNAQVTAGRNNTNTRVTGVTPSYFEIRNIKVGSGRIFTEQQMLALTKLAVLGPTTATDLFGENSDPLGQTIRINGTAFTIVGVTISKGGQGPMNDDDRIYIPLTTAQKIIFGVDNVSAIYIEANSENVMDQARDQIGYFLLNRHKISDPASADFSIMSQEDILSTVNQVTGTFTALLSGIAAISLVVGGIGIMNIMLVTVTERTREIGLRKALGAKRKYIINQFLLEAVMITFTGGVIGITVGLTASFFITKAMSLSFVISVQSILLAFGVSAATGIIFGWYPAKKAADLQPIEALRYE